MILCFECPEAQKREMDDAIAAGRCRDYSEFISVAIATQLLINRRVDASAGFVLDPNDGEPPKPEGPSLAPAAVETLPPPKKSLAAGRRSLLSEAPVAEDGTGQAPTLFAIGTKRPKSSAIARETDDMFSKGDQVPLERWTLGLYNKLLPAKVSVRALANLLNASSSAGLDLNEEALRIAREAKMLGAEFERRDTLNCTERDDRLSTAFPLPSNEEKTISRFANQFVGNVNSRGQYSGLLAALKLIGRAGSSRRKITLTAAGWDFAAIENPCLDKAASAPRLSPEECSFLCAHIKARVPQEVSCIETICSLIANGTATPDQLDVALKPLASKDFDATDSFVATQRTGAISRMSDLGLIERRREGTRVNYVLTKRGLAFLQQGSNT